MVKKPHTRHLKFTSLSIKVVQIGRVAMPSRIGFVVGSRSAARIHYTKGVGRRIEHYDITIGSRL